ncbi:MULTISPECIES: Cof-type HAD-IIB family hydrolase [unclassified Psychrobacillus]|uniref:Cof-type HAD-IIB family hydrolase n=1 Tax=unclassified Psychrobacillus TaxID=2636677 RepID=UPI0011A72060|nr:Cof-type HAD-IIB family hydrolase [Bacillus sp. N3536]
MVQKVLIFDIDGTILDMEKNIPTGVEEAFKQARANGHITVIATGRAPFLAKAIVDQLQIDSYISYNGQIVQFEGKTIHKGIIDKDELKKLSEFAALKDQPLVYMDINEMVSNVPDHQDVIESISTLKVGFPRKAEDFYLNNDIHQSLVFCNEEIQKEYEEAFPNLSFVRWHRVSCDVLPKGMSKAIGIEILLDYLGKDRKDAIAFGDGLNDVEMLKFVGTGVAMGNAVEELKKHATIVTDHVAENGLVNAMKKLELI